MNELVKHKRFPCSTKIRSHERRNVSFISCLFLITKNSFRMLHPITSQLAADQKFKEICWNAFSVKRRINSRCLIIPEDLTLQIDGIIGRIEKSFDEVRQRQLMNVQKLILYFLKGRNNFFYDLLHFQLTWSPCCLSATNPFCQRLSLGAERGWPRPVWGLRWERWSRCSVWKLAKCCRVRGLCALWKEIDHPKKIYAEKKLTQVKGWSGVVSSAVSLQAEFGLDMRLDCVEKSFVEKEVGSSDAACVHS